MFGKSKSSSLPPIDIRTKEASTLLGGKKKVPTSRKEQRAMKKELMKIYPDRCFIDDLGDKNSVTDEGTYIDEFEMYDAIFDDGF